MKADDGTVSARMPALDQVRDYLRHQLRRLGRGELESVRVLIGIAVIWTIFQVANDRYLSAINLSNLVLQMAGVATISIGVVLILLLGEIDLSVGAVSGLASAVMAVLSVKHGVSPDLAIVIGLLVGTAVGLFNGFFVTFIGIPSFVVTLAGLIGWQGAQLAVLGSTGTVNLPESTITDLTSTFFEPGVGWTIAVVAIAAYAAAELISRMRRAQANLEVPPLGETIVKLVAVGAAVAASVAILNQDRGVPLAIVIVVGLAILFSFITQRTRFGRHIYAVGGNAEAARRAGIRINQVRIAVFMLGSTLAAAGGILLASRLLAVNQQSGGSDLLLSRSPAPWWRGRAFSAAVGSSGRPCSGRC